MPNEIECVWCGANRDKVERAKALLNIPDGYPCCEIRVAVNRLAELYSERIASAIGMIQDVAKTGVN
jgi:hypothetical protein